LKKQNWSVVIKVELFFECLPYYFNLLTIFCWSGQAGQHNYCSSLFWLAELKNASLKNMTLTAHGFQKHKPMQTQHFKCEKI